MACRCKKDKLKSIIEGWKNVIWPNEKAEQLALERAKICADCLEKKKANTNWCSECGCYIPAKIRSRYEHCPLKLW